MIELTAEAILAEGLLTTWTCTKSAVSMVVELPSVTHALEAGVAVARALQSGDGIASVTAEPVAPSPSLPADQGEQCVVSGDGACPWNRAEDLETSGSAVGLAFHPSLSRSAASAGRLRQLRQAGACLWTGCRARDATRSGCLVYGPKEPRS